MNTLHHAPQRSSAIPDTLRPLGRVPRTTLRDRLAMRIALALLLWSTRPIDHPNTADQARLLLLEKQRGAREAEWSRRHLLQPLI